MKKCIVCLILISGLLCGCSQKAEMNGNNNTYNPSPVVDNKSDEKEKKEDLANVNNENSGEINKEELINSGENSDNLVLNDTIETEIAPVSSSNLSNKTNAWGFVRKKGNIQPEFSKQYTKVLDNYEGIYVGNSGEKKIYLTFDEGYENGYTDDILDTLKEKEVTAVFFVTMPYVKQNPDLVRRMIEEGHIVRKPHCKSSIYARSN